MDETRKVAELLAHICRHILHQAELELQRFAGALELWVNELLSQRLPTDWREQMHSYLDKWHARGFEVAREHRPILENHIAGWAKLRGSMPAIEEPNPPKSDTPEKASSTVYIPLPADYPTSDKIATAMAWESLQRLLFEELQADRTRQVRGVQRAFGALLRRRTLAQARADRRLSASSSFVDGFVAGLMALRAAATGSADDIATRDEAFRELGIDKSATATKFAASVAVTAAEAAAILAAGGVALGPLLKAYAAYSPGGAMATAYTAQGLVGALAGAKMHAAHRAYAVGNMQEAVDHAAEAFVLAVMVVAGPLLIRPINVVPGQAPGIGTKPVFPPNSPRTARLWPAIMKNGRVYVGRFHVDAVKAANGGALGPFDEYGMVRVDGTGTVIEATWVTQ